MVSERSHGPFSQSQFSINHEINYVLNGNKWYLSTDTWFYIQMSGDQPSPDEFTKYMGQSSPAPWLESARFRSWS